MANLRDLEMAVPSRASTRGSYRELVRGNPEWQKSSGLTLMVFMNDKAAGQVAIFAVRWRAHVPVVRKGMALCRCCSAGSVACWFCCKQAISLTHRTLNNEPKNCPRLPASAQWTYCGAPEDSRALTKV